MGEHAVERLLAGVAGGAEDGDGRHDLRIMHIRWNLCRTTSSISCSRTAPSSRASRSAPPGVAAGEACFTTAMTGYEEAVTDPSYVAQVLCFAYPLIGTYGVDESRMESDRVQCEGVVMRDARPGVRRLAARAGVVALTGARHAHARAQDPRRRRPALRARRRAGRRAPASARSPSRSSTAARSTARSARREPYSVGAGPARGRRRPRLEALDPAPARRRRARGLRRARRVGRRRDPRRRPARRADRERPRRPGACSPSRSRRSARCSAGCPLFGVCLGHQLLGLALGHQTFKLPFGHRGANHPVRDVDDRPRARHRPEPRLRGDRRTATSRTSR